MMPMTPQERATVTLLPPVLRDVALKDLSTIQFWLGQGYSPERIAEDVYAVRSYTRCAAHGRSVCAICQCEVQA